ncbi:hypothetical protein PSTG_15792 [Puccinia striiformis f. sp. tritici PST-78]|uniref:Uncharacterized protein n=1 Tax=Puccinia striiformis f. sp. tritici PST-78 TaxID=1165861 RepID=A0A0L0UVJ9_9BASI|nr:hypothetical protein PSTG_15792 [Puccinia striiformis f. sp. tritici PST-78]
MAKFNDLPAEITHRIIDHVINRNRDHTHDRIGEFRQRPRPQWEHREYRDGSIREIAPWHHDPETSIPVSWPEALRHRTQYFHHDSLGLPYRPLLPFTLVNHKFQQCAQERLFRNVTLKNPWQAYLFLQALITCPTHQQTKSGLRRRSNETQGRHNCGTKGVTSGWIEPPSPSRVAQHVRTLQVAFGPHCSMGRGGGSVICDVIRSCPLLYNICIGASPMSHCKEPIFDALASRQLIKDFVTRGNSRTAALTEYWWMADEIVSRLFTQWDSLETVQFYELSGRPIEMIPIIHNSIPTPKCALRMIILDKPDLDEREYSWLLNSSRNSIRDIEIKNPTVKLDRPGLCRILKEYIGSDLHSLKLEVNQTWHPINVSSSSMNVEDSDDPSINPGLLDIVLKTSSSLKNLRSLYFNGRLAGSEFFARLPQSIVKLAWTRCDLSAATFARALSSWTVNEVTGHLIPELSSNRLDLTIGDDKTRVHQWLPNLKCCSPRDDLSWSSEDREVIEKAIEFRGVCFHSDYTERYIPPPDDEVAEYWRGLAGAHGLELEGEEQIEEDENQDDVIEDD